MEKDQLEQGKHLEEELEKKSDKLEAWEKADSIQSDIKGYSGENSYVWLDGNYIDFNLIKTLAIARLKKEIADLEQQFKAL